VRKGRVITIAAALVLLVAAAVLVISRSTVNAEEERLNATLDHFDDRLGADSRHVILEGYDCYATSDQPFVIVRYDTRTPERALQRLAVQLEADGWQARRGDLQGEGKVSFARIGDFTEVAYLRPTTRGLRVYATVHCDEN
jgi:hypothetical protein